MMLRHIGRAQNHQPHAAGEVPGIKDCDVFKGFRRLTGILITVAYVPCHCNMNDVLRLRQLFGKEALVVLHLGRMGITLSPPGNMRQQFVRPQLRPVQEPPFFRTDVIRAYGKAELFPEGFRKVAHAVRCDQDGAPLCLLEDQDVFFDVRLLGFLVQIHQTLGEDAQHSRLQQRAADRLGQIAAEALLSIEKLVVAARVGGQRYHGHVLAQAARLDPQGVEALDSVHSRHQVVHENAVIMVVLGQPQAFGPAVGHVNLDLGLRQQLLHHHQVHFVVVHHENMRIRRLKAPSVHFAFPHARPGGQRKRSQLPLVHDVLIQNDHKLGALGIDAVYADLAAHQLHQLLNDAESQSRSLNITVFLLVHPPERVENIGNILLLHALAGILHRIPDPHAVDPLPLTPDGQGNGAFAGILHRVVQQIDQNLLDAHLVSAEHAGNGGIHMELKFQALFLGLDPNHVDDFRKEGPGLIGDVDNLHLSGFDFGDVQNVVNQGEQQLAGPLDIPGVLRYLRRDVLPQDDLIESDDRVDGRADLVAHAGKEVILRPVQLLDLLFLPLREGILLLVHPVQEHEQDAGEQPHHNHGKGGVKQCVVLRIRRGKGRIVKGGAVAKQRLRRTKSEKDRPAPSLQGDADVDEAEHKPLRHAAVKAACGKKGDGKQRKQQYRNERGAHVNPFFPNADLDDCRHEGQACQHNQHVPEASAHGQGKRNGDHADAGHNAEHSLAEADPVIGNNLKPFFYHEVFHSSELDIFRKRAGRRQSPPAISAQSAS